MIKPIPVVTVPVLALGAALFAIPASTAAQTAKTTPQPVSSPSLIKGAVPLKGLPVIAGKKTLPPLSKSTIRALKKAGSATQGTTLSRTKARASKSEGGARNEDDPSFGSTGRYCTVKSVDASKGEGDKVVLGNQTDKIYPGALYTDTSILDGSYNGPTGLTRKPYRIATTHFSGASTGPSGVMIQEPSLSSVNDGIAQLMRNNANVINASNVHIRVEQFSSSEQLAFELQADYHGYGAELDAKFAYDKQSAQRMYFFKLTQVYFSVVLDRVDGGLLVSNPSSQVPVNAVYVNKVNYGRIGIVSIKTNHSKEEIEAALKFKYAGSGQSVGATAKAKLDKVLDESHFDGFFFGGDAQNGMVDIKGTGGAALDDFSRYVKDGLRLNAMVAPTPVSYELKYLSDNATAAVNSTTKYEERDCQSGKGVKVTLKGISIEDVHAPEGYNLCNSDTCDSHCGQAWGAISLGLQERTAQGGVKQHVGAMEGTKPVDGTTVRPTVMWARTKSNLAHGILNHRKIFDKSASPSKFNINRTWTYRLDPRVLAEGRYFLSVTSDLHSQHRDNFLAGVGEIGMSGAVTRDEKLGKTWYVGEAAGRPKYGTWVVGPFTGKSNRPHSFRVHFDVDVLE